MGHQPGSRGRASHEILYGYSKGCISDIYRAERSEENQEGPGKSEKSGTGKNQEEPGRTRSYVRSQQEPAGTRAPGSRERPRQKGAGARNHPETRKPPPGGPSVSTLDVKVVRPPSWTVQPSCESQAAMIHDEASIAACDSQARPNLQCEPSDASSSWINDAASCCMIHATRGPARLPGEVAAHPAHSL